LDVEARDRQGVRAVLEEVLAAVGANQECLREVLVVEGACARTSAATLATGILSQSSEERALKRHLVIDALEAAEEPNPPCSRR
jgi:hypothetical protein